MKKTLAAVLAAAMALSTASVAFAKDRLDGDTVLDNDYSTVDNGQEIRFGKTYKYLLSADVLEATDIDPYQLGEWVKNGIANVTVTVTDGMGNLKEKPTAKVVNVHTADAYDTIYTWKYGRGDNSEGFVFDNGKTKETIAKKDAEIKAIPLHYDEATKAYTFTLTEDEITHVVHKGGKIGGKTFEWYLENQVVGSGEEEAARGKADRTTSPVVEIGFAVAHTYGTGSKDVSMKFRITFKKDAEGTDYHKGDTVMADEVTFTAKYRPMNDVGTEMELTQEECKDANEYVLMNKDSELYDRIGSDEFTVYFENSASFTGKMAPNQKTLNLTYSVADIDDVVKAYPSIDFEFIDFKGQVANATTFVNTGTMSFNAIGGADTVVYEMDSEGGLTKLDGKFNKIADTIDVKGIKKLTTYVIAETEIPEEEEPEEPSEPASSAPAIEDDNNGNPNTGAC